MALVQITKPTPTPLTPEIFDLGFRPFFLVAAASSIISVAVWMLLYTGTVSLPLASLSPSQWHAHEMLYGYSMAVIAGFILTALMNWTGVQTLTGKPLAGLVALWLVGRILFLFGSPFLQLASCTDTAFSIFLLTSVTATIRKSPLKEHAPRWQHGRIVLILLLLALGNLSFTLGVFGVLPLGIFYSLYGALYVITTLILTIGDRVMADFIQNGVDENVTIPRSPRLSVTTTALMLAFVANQLFIQERVMLISLPLALFALTALRLVQWHTRGIWTRPLLWGLYVAFLFISLGFLLSAATALWGINPFLSLHAFAFGGIGVATLAMMSRVTLGHTGRSIHSPPATTSYALRMIVTGACVRVLLPLLFPHYYTALIVVAQWLWMGAFVLFAWSYSRLLLSKYQEFFLCTGATTQVVAQSKIIASWNSTRDCGSMTNSGVRIGSLDTRIPCESEIAKID